MTAAPTRTAPAPVASLRPDELNLAPGVQFPAERVPQNPDAARAVAALASAIRTGDVDTLRPMLDPADSAVLDTLVDSGQWADSHMRMTTVRVCALETTDDTVRVGLGIEDDRGAYLIGWNGKPEQGDWRFASLPIKDHPGAKASDLDGASLEEMNIPVAGPSDSQSAPTRPPVETQRRRRRN